MSDPKYKVRLLDEATQKILDKEFYVDGQYVISSKDAHRVMSDLKNEMLRYACNYGDNPEFKFIPLVILSDDERFQNSKSEQVKSK